MEENTEKINQKHNAFARIHHKWIRREDYNRK
jgi:hypothetical protein